MNKPWDKCILNAGSDYVYADKADKELDDVLETALNLEEDSEYALLKTTCWRKIK